MDQFTTAAWMRNSTSTIWKTTRRNLRLLTRKAAHLSTRIRPSETLTGSGFPQSAKHGVRILRRGCQANPANESKEGNKKKKRVQVVLKSHSFITVVSFAVIKGVHQLALRRQREPFKCAATSQNMMKWPWRRWTHSSRKDLFWSVFTSCFCSPNIRLIKTDVD